MGGSSGSASKTPNAMNMKGGGKAADVAASPVVHTTPGGNPVTRADFRQEIEPAPTTISPSDRLAMQANEYGAQAVQFARDQAAISNRWARQDRRRYNEVFRPVEDQFVADSMNYDTRARRQSEMNRAGAAAQRGLAAARGTMRREQAAMGVNPTSGRARGIDRTMALQGGLATVGARNAARDAVRLEGRNRMAQAVNLGKGFQVNPATSLGMGTAAGMGGYGAGMQGVGLQSNIQGQQFDQNMRQQELNAQNQGAMWGGIGSLLGTGLSLFSSKDMKTNKRPARGALRAVERMPVEEWDYKEGQGDGGRHVGPYAEDFKAATGKGDGKTIPIVDAIGTTMGAVQELSAKVDKLEARTRGAVRNTNSAPQTRGARAA